MEVPIVQAPLERISSAWTGTARASWNAALMAEHSETEGPSVNRTRLVAPVDEYMWGKWGVCCAGIFGETFKRLNRQGKVPDVFYPAVPIPTDTQLQHMHSSWRDVLKPEVAAFMKGKRVFLSINRFERKKVRGRMPSFPARRSESLRQATAHEYHDAPIERQVASPWEVRRSKHQSLHTHDPALRWDMWMLNVSSWFARVGYS